MLGRIKYDTIISLPDQYRVTVPPHTPVESSTGTRERNSFSTMTPDPTVCAIIVVPLISITTKLSRNRFSCRLSPSEFQCLSKFLDCWIYSNISFVENLMRCLCHRHQIFLSSNVIHVTKLRAMQGFVISSFWIAMLLYAHISWRNYVNRFKNVYNIFRSYRFIVCSFTGLPPYFGPIIFIFLNTYDLLYTKPFKY